jgi:hypothetical protein
MARVIAEQLFAQPMSDDDYAVVAKRLDSCLAVRNAAWRRSYVSMDRRRITCEFEAPDAETVREAMRMADIPFERVWTAEVFAVEDYPEAKATLDGLLASQSRPR